MKRKYFLRGMGIGIFVTALIFTVSMLFSGYGMSEKQIIKEAKKLGMVESNEAVDNASSGELSVEEEIKKTESEVKDTADKISDDASKAKDSKEDKEEEKTEANQGQAEANEQQANANLKKEEARQEQEKAKQEQADAKAAEELTRQAIGSTAEKKPSSGKDVSFSVKSGENSSTVSANLYKAGLVDDAGEFDRYLEQHNLDNYVQDGTFSIKEGSTYQEIAKILTGR